MRTLLRTLICALLACAVAGCGLVYHPSVQQGNLLDKKTVDQLKPGMTKRQVIVLLGSPSVASPFDHDRWDYVRTYATRGNPMNTQAFTLYFNNDVLVRTEGNFFTADAQKLLEQSKAYDTDAPKDGKPGDKDTNGAHPDTSMDGIGRRHPGGPPNG
jgi:outer membrane protein assembly factor BamE